MRRQALSLLVENNPGVTSRISGLFSRRGYNIDSFSSGVTADPNYKNYDCGKRRGTDLGTDREAA